MIKGDKYSAKTKSDEGQRKISEVKVKPKSKGNPDLSGKAEAGWRDQQGEFATELKASLKRQSALGDSVLFTVYLSSLFVHMKESVFYIDDFDNHSSIPSDLIVCFEFTESVYKEALDDTKKRFIAYDKELERYRSKVTNVGLLKTTSQKEIKIKGSA